MRRIPYFFFLLIFSLVLISAHAANAAQSLCRVLVVMSYHDGYPWQDEQRQGITESIGKKCELAFFNLDSKRFPETTAIKAREAFALFQQMKPDGVIAGDDPAQSHFVIPYLMNKVKTPVIFCGVNAKAETHGYPASNVTGVLERYHSRETVSLLRQLVPAVKTLAIMTRGNDQTGEAIIRELRDESASFLLKTVGFFSPATIEEALSQIQSVRAEADVLFLEHFEGIPDRLSRRLSHKEAVQTILATWGNKPTLCANEYTVRFGCLAAVRKSGIEHGLLAGGMMHAAVTGTPVSSIPMTRNRTGVKAVNVTVMKELDIDPPLNLLREVKLMRTEQ